MQVTIGADPEFFVRRGLHYLSGHIFDCGTKYKPRRTEHGFIQMDGIALECNVQPSSTPEEFATNLRKVVSDLSGVVHSVHNDASLVAKPSIFFGNKRLKTIPPEFAELGCQPDFNAYTTRINRRPNSNLPIRTGSGHIHIGWTENENPRSKAFFQLCCRIVKQLDYYLGLPSLLWDNDDRRRQLYGMAGAFRPKPYGLEYRVLSNKWVENDKLVRWIFSRAVAATQHILEEECEMDLMFSGMAADFINTNKKSWPEIAPGLASTVLVP